MVHYREGSQDGRFRISLGLHLFYRIFKTSCRSLRIDQRRQSVVHTTLVSFQAIVGMFIIFTFIVGTQISCLTYRSIPKGSNLCVRTKVWEGGPADTSGNHTLGRCAEIPYCMYWIIPATFLIQRPKGCSHNQMNENHSVFLSFFFFLFNFKHTCNTSAFYRRSSGYARHRHYVSYDRVGMVKLNSAKAFIVIVIVVIGVME